jgi:cytochrome P450 family 4
MQKSLILSKTAKFFAYFSPITLILFTVLLVSYAVWKRRRARLVECIDKLPGPATTPLIGNALEINVQHDGE